MCKASIGYWSFIASVVWLVKLLINLIYGGCSYETFRLFLSGLDVSILEQKMNVQLYIQQKRRCARLSFFFSDKLSGLLIRV